MGIAMGREKDRLIEKEENWDRVASSSGFRCDGCGRVLTKDEYDMYTRSCSGCAPSLFPNQD